jgi:L-fucose isomerase
MGLYPMTASGLEIMKTFGVDLDHVDQLEIVRLSAEIHESKIQTAYRWLSKHVRSISSNAALSRSKLETQIRHMMALKNLIGDHQFDFVGIKCHTEMSQHQVPQCLSACLLNDPYDWDGERAPVIAACEADIDGALTMQIMHLLTRLPACLLDIRYFVEKDGVYVFQNCGSAPSWFAGHSENPEENLKKVSLCPCIAKFEGGGAHVRFQFHPGRYTLARLHHSPQGYAMTVLEGEVISAPDNILGSEPSWPLAVIRIAAKPEELRDKLQAVHLHAVFGRHAEALKTYCRFMNIPCEIFEDQ